MSLVALAFFWNCAKNILTLAQNAEIVLASCSFKFVNYTTFRSAIQKLNKWQIPLVKQQIYSV